MTKRGDTYPLFLGRHPEIERNARLGKYNHVEQIRIIQEEITSKFSNRSHDQLWPVRS